MTAESPSVGARVPRASFREAVLSPLQDGSDRSVASPKNAASGKASRTSSAALHSALGRSLVRSALPFAFKTESLKGTDEAEPDVVVLTRRRAAEALRAWAPCPRPPRPRRDRRGMRRSSPAPARASGKGRTIRRENPPEQVSRSSRRVHRTPHRDFLYHDILLCFTSL